MSYVTNSFHADIYAELGKCRTFISDKRKLIGTITFLAQMTFLCKKQQEVYYQHPKALLTDIDTLFPVDEIFKAILACIEKHGLLSAMTLQIAVGNEISPQFQLKY